MRKLCTSNEKGGVGKTTSAVNIAHGLALRGERVILIDGDSQGNCGPALGITEIENTLADVLLGECTWDQAIIEARPNLDLIPSSPRLAEAKDQLVARLAAEAVVAMSQGKQSTAEHNFLTHSLSGITGYAYLIIDCAPSRDVLNSNALRFVNEVMMTVSVDYLSTVGAGQHTKAIREAQESGSQIKIAYVIPTLYDRRTIKSREVLAELHSFFGEVVTPYIPTNVSLAEAPSFGQTIYEYAPRSTGATAYAELVERIATDG